jgi:phage terminase large subunit-like protein
VQIRRRGFEQREAWRQVAGAPALGGATPLRLMPRTKVTFKTYEPNAKQREFHAAGAQHRERLFKAGNQLGKTTSGGIEAAYHLTGRYPAWWSGRRFAHPVRAWAGSTGFETTRDGVQRILVGEPKDRAGWGSGLIPKSDLVDWSLRGGVRDALDGITVRHVSGGTSTLGFKSYVQGREKWQAETLDFVWFDEEPPLEIYTEGLTRTNATGGMVYLTLTPLLGMSDVMMLFKDCPGF